MASIWQDIRYTIRALLKRPGFTAIAVLTIALGIGASTSIFSVVNGVLLKPLPLHEPQELVNPDVIAAISGFSISLSIPNFKDWRERNRTLETFGANMRRTLSLTGGDRPELIVTRWILGDYFEALGVPPAIGRVIPSDETWEGAAPVAVVTHGFWKRHLGADPNPLGRTITLNAETFEVIGVMPPEFQFPSADTEVFLPMGYFSENLCWEQRGCSQGTWAIGRLKAGVPIEMAQADLDRVIRELEEEEGQEMAAPRLNSLTDAYIGDIRPQIWILMGAVGFVLLIACANVASLLLARGEGRRREVALRTALGAGRGRVIRQLLTESLVLALVGGLLGVGLAFGGVRLLVPAISDDIPSILVGGIGLDLRVLAFTLGVSLLAGLVFGVAPALRASKTDLVDELKEGGRGGTTGKARQRLRQGLVMAEVALSLVLLIGAGLMIQSLRELQNVDKGFVADNIFTARASLPAVRYDEKQKAWSFFDGLLQRVQGLPGVKTASLTQIVPLQGNSWERGIIPEGVAAEPENFSSVLYHMVSTDHFATFGIPMLRGRTFTEADIDGRELVCIIDDTMAEKFWPGEDPIGKRVTFEETEESTPENPIRVYRTVVGVANNVRHYELENPSRIQVYVPMAQSERAWSRAMFIVAKTQGDPLALTELVRRELTAMDPDVPLAQVETMEGYVADGLSETRVVGGLLTVFSVMALILSAIGIFGVMSFSVVQRVREIGIRMALGAKSGDVVRMVSRQGLLVTLSGVGIGLFAAFALTRLMTSILYQVDPVEPVTYAGLSGFLIGVSLLAAYIPARRATSVDPATVLREE